ncbi:MAG: cupredoxin domain-containing protein [Thermoplasmata archaeon]
MRSWLRTAFVLLLILTISTVFLALLSRPIEQFVFPEPSREYFNITMSLSAIDPDEIVVKQDTLVFLNITSLDERHMFGLLAYAISKNVPAKETVTVSFVAGLLGSFTFQCQIVSPEHLLERGTLTVIE